MSALDKIKQGKRLTAAFLYELLYGIANGDLATQNNNLPYWRNKTFYDHVIEGCVWTGDSYGSTLLASMTAGQVMIDGQLIDVDAVANRAFTASKDTYVDVDINGALTYTEVSNNAASPALAASRVRLGVIVTGASSIASANSVNQGQPEKTVPTTCNLGKSGIDSLGNLIRNTSPTPVYRFTKTNNALTSVGSASYADVSGQTISIPLITKCNLVITTSVQARWQGAPSVTGFCNIMVDSVQQTEIRTDIGVNGAFVNYSLSYQVQKSAGTVVVKNQVKTSTGTLDTMGGAITVIAYPVR